MAKYGEFNENRKKKRKILHFNYDDISVRSKIKKRQDKRQFIEQLDELMSAINSDFTGSIYTKKQIPSNKK